MPHHLHIGNCSVALKLPPVGHHGRRVGAKGEGGIIDHLVIVLPVEIEARRECIASPLVEPPHRLREAIVAHRRDATFKVILDEAVCFLYCHKFLNARLGRALYAAQPFAIVIISRREDIGQHKVQVSPQHTCLAHHRRQFVGIGGDDRVRANALSLIDELVDMLDVDISIAGYVIWRVLHPDIAAHRLECEHVAEPLIAGKFRQGV